MGLFKVCVLPILKLVMLLCILLVRRVPSVRKSSFKQQQQIYMMGVSRYWSNSNGNGNVLIDSFVLRGEVIKSQASWWRSDRRGSRGVMKRGRWSCGDLHATRGQGHRPVLQWGGEGGGRSRTRGEIWVMSWSPMSSYHVQVSSTIIKKKNKI